MLQQKNLKLTGLWRSTFFIKYTNTNPNIKLNQNENVQRYPHEASYFYIWKRKRNKKKKAKDIEPIHRFFFLYQDIKNKNLHHKRFFTIQKEKCLEYIFTFS